MSLRGSEPAEAIYYHSDHLGSSNIITNQNGQQAQYCEYTPYGTIAKNEGSDVVKHKFTGKELDYTGLYFYGARYYDPEIGRFITADTIVQAPYDPQSLNRYSYCRNNPINYIDLSGHFFWFIAAIIIGAIMGGVSAAINGGNIGMGILMGALGGALVGAGAAATSALWGPAWAFVGASVGGATSGAANAAVSGGNIGMGSLIGGIGAGVGCGIGYGIGQAVGPFWGAVAGGFTGGGVAGGVGAEFSGGNFGQGFGLGAAYGTVGAMAGYGAAKTFGGSNAQKATQDLKIDQKVPDVRAAMNEAWQESLDGQATVHEQGGWIDKHSVYRWPQGQSGSISVPNTRPSGTIAEFHTHPYSSSERFFPGASPNDFSGLNDPSSSVYGIRHFIIDRQGVIEYYSDGKWNYMQSSSN